MTKMTATWPDSLRPDVRKLVEMYSNKPGPAVHELSVPDARQLYIEIMKVTDVATPKLDVIRDLQIPGPAGTMEARLFDARTTRPPGPVMVFIHGGGWIMGNLNISSPFCADLALALDLPVVAIDYRLAPEHKFPAAYVDCEAAIRWVASGPAALGRSVTGLVISGESAGGGLTISTTMALRDKPAQVPVIVHAPIVPIADVKNSYPSRQIQPTFGWNSPALAWVLGLYQPDVNDWRVSPLLGNLTGMPSAVVATAELDVLRDEGRAYAAALAQAGTPLVTYLEALGSLHGYYLMRKAAPSCADDVAAFFVSLKAAIDVESRRLLGPVKT